ncbi:MAG: type II toxin-antitoxin system MqsA family antitoxin [Candidatus Eisenbacteria sp.]|nr:type II toxin-antitoxin system MqsA family antitoxin [Candidatus Eisenbacteria bacterium]
MKCRVCGGSQHSTSTDLPFKVSESTIVILKGTPVFQCANCSEYSFEDAVMERVDVILASVDPSAELEVIRFAA